MNFVTMILANQYLLIQKNNSLTHTKNTSSTTTFSSSFFVLLSSQIQYTHQHTHTDEKNYSFTQIYFDNSNIVV